MKAESVETVNECMVDRKIMDGLGERVPQALDQLNQKYGSILRSVAKQVLHDEADVDEVLQEVLIQVWERPWTYSSSKGKLASWLCSITRRRAIDKVRRLSAYKRATDRYEIVCNHPDKSFDETHAVETRAFQDDLGHILSSYLSALPPSQRDVIRLAYFEGLSQREISQRTGSPLGTVKTRVELALKKLTHAMGSLRMESFV